MDVSAPTILEIGVVLLAAGLAGAVMRRLGLPAIVGYILVGMAISPFTPGYVADRDQLQLFADIGVVLLLFEVGIEIDPLELGRQRRHLLWAAPIHTLGVAAVGSGLGFAFGLGWKAALILGLAVALSSSVVVVNITRSRWRVTNTATNHALLGWSILQDITGVALAGTVLATMGLEDRPVWWSFAGILLFVAVAMGTAYVLPRVLHRLRDQPDLFLLVTVAGGLTIAAVGEQAFGIPLALAAFVAGLAISESEVTAAARRRLLPFRDVFAVLFFVALGSLFDPGAVPDAIGWIALVLSLVLVLKIGTIYVAARLIRIPDVSNWQLAFGLGQIGEFSFVLASVGFAEGLIDQNLYTAILSAVAGTIAASAIVVRRRPWQREVAIAPRR